MATSGPGTDSSAGYLSEESKRRFTLLAGLLGAGFFLLQFVLPFVLMIAIVLPLFVAIPWGDVDEAVAWNGSIWYLEQIETLSWSGPASSRANDRLRQVRVDDLEPVGSAELAPMGERRPRLLPIGDRLWIVGTERVGYYDTGGLHSIGPAARPDRASRIFAYRDRPAAIVSGKRPALVTLVVEGAAARWDSMPFVPGAPDDGGDLGEVQGVDTSEGLVLVAEFCGEDGEERACSLYYRALAEPSWRPLGGRPCGCSGWSALLHRGRATVVLPGRGSGARETTDVVTLADDAPRTERLTLAGDAPWARSRPMSVNGRLLFVTEEMPGSPVLWEARDGRLARVAERGGWFPVPARMMALMMLPHLAPMLLSLVLALVLTVQMRRHRVPDYTVSGSTARFATLWQRALAQIVDLVPMVAVFALPIALMFRLLSHPESLAGRGPFFVPLVVLSLLVAGLLGALLVLVAYSYFEGRTGRTPGKRLLRIRVVGTDLKPCGFGRAFLRNLLTIVDGFFNFLVGALLVALTENWQRLGDLAARTIVVADGERS
ncbi:MAG: RDD family protein [Vicinamibacteria bacterium]